MGSKVGRNDPCPCGSGRKHKQCCEGKVIPTKGTKVLVAVLAAICLGLAITAGVFGGVKAGIGVGFAGALVIGIFLVVRRPPPSTGNRSGTSDIRFGR